MTSTGLMRRLLPSRLFRNAGLSNSSTSSTTLSTTTFSVPCASSPTCLTPTSCRCSAQTQTSTSLNREVYFRSTSPLQSNDHKPPDERTLQLGKTVRTLHSRLPTLLLSPLPSEILSPNITLHLFPSTHPHLPTVSGRLAYVAALWTAPVAWGRIPLVGNVKLTILSERMVRNGGTSVSTDQRDEKLIVKWKTCGKTTHRDGSGGIYRGVGISAKDPVDKIKSFISGAEGEEGSDGREEEFCGIFVFEFDERGKIRKHVIEHTEEGGHFDKMTRVVSVTDWLLGQFNGSKNKERVPELALCEEKRNRRDEH